MDIISIILAMALLLYVKDIITTKQIIVCIIVCILFKLNRSKRLFEGMTDSTATDELNNESLANISSLYNGDELIVNKLKVTGDVEIGGKTTMSDSLKINAATGSSGISITGGGFENNLVRSAHYIKQGSNDVYKNEYGTIHSKVLKASDYVLAGDGSKHHIYMQSDQSAGKSYIKSKNNNTFGPVYIGTGGTNIANSGTISSVRDVNVSGNLDVNDKAYLGDNIRTTKWGTIYTKHMEVNTDEAAHGIKIIGSGGLIGTVKVTGDLNADGAIRSKQHVLAGDPGGYHIYMHTDPSNHRGYVKTKNNNDTKYTDIIQGRLK